MSNYIYDDDFDDDDDFDAEYEAFDAGYEYGGEDMDFADPGGTSALRAGPRVHPCPTCRNANRLSAKDVQLGYQCDPCADALERGGGY